MPEQRLNNNIWPFLLGMLCGALLGILLAPEKGEVTRKKLKRKTAELKGKLEPSLEEIREKVAPVMEELTARAGPVLAGFKKLEQFEDDVKEELTDTFEEEEGLPLDTSLSEHKIELSKEEHSKPAPSRHVSLKPKRKSLFKNLK